MLFEPVNTSGDTEKNSKEKGITLGNLPKFPTVHRILKLLWVLKKMMIVPLKKNKTHEMSREKFSQILKKSSA